MRTAAIRQPLVLTALALLLMLLAGCGGGTPGVTGMQFEAASELVSNKGLDAERVDRFVEGADTGEVVAQQPEPGEPIPEDNTILLTVAGGVPDVVGLSFEGARDQLESLGFRIDRSDEYVEGGNVGEVVEQVPDPGGALGDGERVELVVGAPFSTDVSGTLVLKDGFFGEEGESCQGSGGYSDMRGGAPVSVMNGEGEVVATGQLSHGEAEPEGSLTGSDLMYCSFNFAVNDVEEASTYQITVADRGGLTYTFEEMEQQGWQVNFELG